jgi:hypothetical protein
MSTQFNMKTRLKVVNKIVEVALNWSVIGVKD